MLMRSRVFAFHELVEGASDSFYTLSADRFAQALVMFARSGGPASVRPEITFDDGHESNARLAAPLLRLHDCRATFFVTAGWTGARDGFMDWSQLAELLALGHKVECHGLTHRFLTQLDGAELDSELRGARALLEDRLGRGVSEISLPGGRYDRRVLARCAEAGYRRVYSSVPWSASVQTDGVELRGRLVVNRRMSTEWLRRYARGDAAPYVQLRGMHAIREAAKGALGDDFYHKAWSVVSRRRGMKANAR